MDDELSQLEAELKDLRPAAPSRELIARIEADLAPSAVSQTPDSGQGQVVSRASRAWWALAGALPMAAAFTVGLLVVSRRDSHPGVTPPVVATHTTGATVGSAKPVEVAAQTPTTDAEEFKPVTSENVLYAVADEGLVTLADGTAARRERLNYVDTITWKNPRTNASVRWTVPREEVRVVPVKFQ